MPTSLISKIFALGLATLTGAGLAVGNDTTPPTIADPPSQAVMVEEAPSDAAPPASQIDPALLNNPTLRRAIRQVGPELLRDPQVREAIRTGNVGQHLLSNPTVSRAMLRVGPSLMADPQLSAAIRSGALGPDLLNDPAVIRIITDLDPTFYDTAETEPAPMPPVVEVLPPIAEPTVTETTVPVIDVPVITELPSAPGVDVENVRRGARGRAVRAARHAMVEAARAAREDARSARTRPVESRRMRAAEAQELRNETRETIQVLFGLGLEIAGELASAQNR